MFADEDKVATRRIKRRLKAAASIFVALAAGTFLACRRDPVDSDPDVDEPTDDAPSTTATASDADAGASAPSATSTAMATTEPSAKAPPKATVDKNQHRKGMPVPDNLLE